MRSSVPWTNRFRTDIATTAARAGEAGTAWRHFDDAVRVAQRLPADYSELITVYGQPVMDSYAVRLDVELQRPGEAIQRARRIDLTDIPSQPRRGRYLMDLARAHQQRNDLGSAVDTLLQAHEVAPDSIRYSLGSRRILIEALEGPPAVRPRANELAVKVGMIK